MTGVKVIILLSGKRKSGKDYVAALLHTELGDEQCCILRLSGPLKQQYAQEQGIDFERLLDASEYKEFYRADMIRWGEEKRNKDYGYFCRLIASGLDSEKPVWIISDARRRTDFQYFEENYHYNVFKVRIVATEDTRQSRGWIFTPGVDDAPSECDLDTGVSFDIVITNNGDSDALTAQLTDLVHSVNARLSEQQA